MTRAVSSAAAAFVLACATTARAEPPRTGDAAAAQALFYEARALMKDGNYAVACPKLEESLRLDYGIGTEYNLADCNENLGRLATAWSGFVNVAAAAKRHAQAERERVARERAKALEPRLPRLTIDVPAGAPADLEVTRDGIGVGPASWGTPVPVDPGPHRITATATGRQRWQVAVSTKEGEVVRVTVPRELPAVTVTLAAPVAVAAPAPVPQRVEPEPAALATFPDPIVEERGGPQRTIGWIVGGLGIAGLGVGAGFGIDSLQSRDRSKSHCRGDLCDARGVDLRDRAMRSGDVATVATVAGGAALLGGVVLVLTAPRGSSPRENAGGPSLYAAPRLAANGGGISIEGVLP